MSNDPAVDSARDQLRRLKTLTDVVYGAALVVVIGWLPLPEETEGARWLIDVFAAHPANLIATLLGLLYLIIYWMRSNVLMADLDVPARCMPGCPSPRSSSCSSCSSWSGSTTSSRGPALGPARALPWPWWASSPVSPGGGRARRGWFGRV